MSIVDANGEITQLSVSQVTVADSKQEGGCMRRWWFEVPNGLKPEQSYERNEGTAGHELFRRYFLTGESPKGRTLMGKAVTGAIVKGGLPTPGPGLNVELRFSGQPMRDYSRCECGHALDVHDKEGCAHRPIADDSGTDPECTCQEFRPAWVPLDRSRAFKLAGVVWDGAIDLWHGRDGIPAVWDHKFSSDPDLYAKKNSELIQTVQMPVYCAAVAPNAPRYELTHHYVSKKGVYSFLRRAVVTRDQVLERLVDIHRVVTTMKLAAKAKDQNDVPASPGAACDAWRGCPHQSICSAFKKQRSTNRGETTVALSELEEAIFDSIPMDDAPAAPAPAAAPAPVAPGTAPVVDEADPEEAAITAQLAAAQEAQKKLEEKKAKRRMLIQDVPPPVETKTEAWSAACKCGETVNAENGSKLQSGEVKHIGCKLDAPPPAPKAPKKTKPDAPPPLPPATPVAEPAFRGESQTDRAARAASDAMAAAAKAKKEAAPPAPVVAATTPAQIPDVAPPAAKKEPTLLSATGEPTPTPRNEALARLFDSCAALLRAP